MGAGGVEERSASHRQRRARHLKGNCTSYFLLYAYSRSVTLCLCLSVVIAAHTDFLPEPPCRLMKFRWVESLFNSAVQIRGYSCVDNSTHALISLFVFSFCLNVLLVTSYLFLISRCPFCCTFYCVVSSTACTLRRPGGGSLTVFFFSLFL